MEASGNFSNEKIGGMSVYIDTNQNNKVDTKDIWYEMHIREGKEVFGARYSVELKEFNSNALVKYNFVNTKNESRSHPVWSIKIPKKEVWNKLGIVYMRFEYNPYDYECLQSSETDCIVRIPKYNKNYAAKSWRVYYEFGPVIRLRFNP